MAERYSKLGPLDVQSRGNLALMLCHFFSVLKNKAHREQLSLPVTPGRAEPLSIVNFITWAKAQNGGFDGFRYQSALGDVVRKLEQSGILIHAGVGQGSPPLNNCYYFLHERSSTAQKGMLWLGQALGPDYIGHQVLRVLTRITGITPKGDSAVGSGVLVMPDVVLTCAHVITDMKLDESINIAGRDIAILHVKSDPKVDIGTIRLAESLELPLPDLAFRPARILEDVVIAGFPTVPRGLTPVATLNRGEISGRLEETMDGYPLELFSAIARPGNSGGPVVGLDGRIVGIVTRSLERQREEADAMSPMPFFSAVPAEVIRDSFNALIPEAVLPWEDYE